MSCKIMMSAEFCNYIYNSFSVIVYLWNVILNMDITLLLNKSGGLDAMPEVGQLVLSLSRKFVCFSQISTRASIAKMDIPVLFKTSLKNLTSFALN